MNYYNEIKNELINNGINRKVKNYSINKSDLNTYYNVGKMLSEAGKHYGEGIIKEYSKKLTAELGKGYSKRNLWLMLRYFQLNEKVQTLSAQLSWSHYCELLSINDINEIDYYINISLNNEINRKVKTYSINKSDLTTYYNVGKVLSEAGKHYGEGIIKEYSKNLTKELGKGYTQSRLRYIRRFYDVFSKCPTLSDELSFSHYCEIIWDDNYNKINYYVTISVNQNLSVRQLREKIRSNEYDRLDDNTKKKIMYREEKTVTDFVKNPIIIKNISNSEN